MLDDCGPKNECRMLKRLSIVLAVLAATSCSKPFVIVQIADVQMGFAAAALAAVPARREAELWLPCQPGENKSMCGSYGSLSLLPGS